MIGIKLPVEKMVSILTSLGFEVKENSGNMTVTVPSYRATKDVSLKADLVEEIARVYGYDNITPLTRDTEIKIVREDPEQVVDYTIKDLLAEKFNMSEIQSYVWYDLKKNKELNIETKDNIKIINSIDGDNSVLRATMIPTMLCATEKNIKYMNDVRMFEIGKVWEYPVKGENCIEKKNLGAVFASKVDSEELLVHTALQAIHSIVKQTKNLVPHFAKTQNSEEYNWINPVNSSDIYVGEKCIGYVSTLNLKVQNAIDKKMSCVLVELYLDVLNSIEKADIKVKDVSKYQTVTFDLSFIVDNNTEFRTFEDVLVNQKILNLNSYELVDIFESSEKLRDKKSVTIRFTLGAEDHTLDSAEIENARHDVIELFESRNISMRG